MRLDVRFGAVIATGIAALAAIVWLTSGPGEPPGTASPTPTNLTGVERHPAPPAAAGTPVLRREARPEAAPKAPAGDQPSVADSSESAGDDQAVAWSAVDLEAVRQAMPDNLYWKRSAPTKDPRVLEERDAERARGNVEYGKVLSGTATDEEIRAYYDFRARISADHIEFATYLLDHYANTLPERDTDMLKLGLRLHRARLEEIPRKIEEAFARKRAQDAAREAWLADQADFGAPKAGSDSEGDRE